MRRKRMEEAPMSQSLFDVPQDTAYHLLTTPHLSGKSSLQRVPYPSQADSGPETLLGDFPSHSTKDLPGLVHNSEIRTSASMTASLPDPYTWDFEMSDLAGTSVLDIQDQDSGEGSFLSSCENSEWLDINQLLPTPEDFQYYSGNRDLQTTQQPSESIHSPASFPDTDILLSQFDMYGINPRASLDSISRPGSVVYSPLTTDNSMTSSPLGDQHLALPPRSVPNMAKAHLEEESDMDPSTSDEPYARLIWRALMSAPGHKMVLKEIYEWFEKHTKKAANDKSKGWQNSIRHNLSMNAAFEGVREVASPGGSPKKSGNAWVLTDRAIKYGVQSTTRYRKPGIHKKTAKSEHPAPQRQRSGAKGGRAAKKAAKFRRALEAHQTGENHCYFDSGMTTHAPFVPTETHHLPLPNPDAFVANEYNLSDLSGCTEFSKETPIFYHGIGPGEKGLFPGYSDSQIIGLDYNSFL